MFKLAVITTLVLCSPAGAAISKARIDAVVREAYPQRLIALADEHRNLAGNLPQQRAVSAVLSTTADRATVVAAYSDDELGAVQVIEIGTTSRIVASYAPLLDAGPGEPQLELLDVDGDGADEIFVEFPHVRSPFALTYVLKFAAGELILLSPTVCRKVDPGFVTSDLLFVDVIDLDGDKTFELVDRREQRLDGTSVSEEEAVIEGVRLWKFSGGNYQRLAEAVFFERYARESGGGPETVPAEFYAHPGPGDLVVVNGVAATSRVSSAMIDLNGSTVVSPDRLSQNVSRVAVPVTLKQSNVLTVKLAGKPGAGVIIYIVPRGKSEEPCD